MRAIVAAMALMASAASAQAPEIEAPCPAVPAALPGGSAGWARPTRIVAATDAAGAARVTLTVGKAATLTLAATPAVRFAAVPAKAGDAGSRGGMVSVDVARAGRYRVALGSAAWIDVVRDGKALASTGHGHGPACSGIRKIVDFMLARGKHLLQIAGSATPTATVMIVPAP